MFDYLCKILKKRKMKKIVIFITITSLIFTMSFSCKKQKTQTNNTEQITANTTDTTIHSTANIAVDTNTRVNTNTNNGKVVSLTTETFKELVFDYSVNNQWKFNGSLPCIIDFYADWCGPCKRVAPIMEELAKQYKGRVNFYKINVDNNPEVAQVFQVNSIPAVLFVPLNDKPQMAVGAMPKETYIKAINDVLKVQ